MEPITDPQKLAAAVADIIRDGKRWNQTCYFSSSWEMASFASQTIGGISQHYRFPAEEARETLSEHCGSTACVAGWTAILASPPGTLITNGDYLIFPIGTTEFAFDYARDKLQLLNEQARYLFFWNRTREEVLEALEDIASGHPEKVTGGCDGTNPSVQ